MNHTSRRHFLKAASITATAALAGHSLPAWGRSTTDEAVASPLSVFDYSQVQLLDSLFREQFENNHKVFLNLDEDGLLKPFRQRQGMPAPGPDLGGWYDNSDDFDPTNNFHGFIPGHSFGQYVSGLARAYAVTGSKPTQAKVHRLVRAYAETVEPTGNFYVDYRLPGYTFDKTCCGLIDAHEFAGDPIALDVLKRSTDAVLPHLPGKALSRAEQEARPHKGVAFTWDETYTLSENLFLAYMRSSDKRYLDLAKRFIYHEYYDALAEDHNALPGKHAYSHVNTLSSAMQAYLVLEMNIISAPPPMGCAWCTSKVTQPGAGGRMKDSSNPAKDCWATVSSQRTPVSKRPAVHMATSRLLATCCESLAIRVMATAWKGCCTTRLRGPNPFFRMAHRSTTPTTTTIKVRKFITAISGHAAPAHFLN